MLTNVATLRPRSLADVERFTVFGVRISNVTRRHAAELIDAAICGYDGRAASVYFVNAHTLNLAASDPSYRDVLNASDSSLPTALAWRWAAQVGGEFAFARTWLAPTSHRDSCRLAGRGYSYFMLGANARTIATAAEHANRAFPGMNLAGFHHGYLTSEEITAVAIDQINAAQPGILLVGMGNPLQERWIAPIARV